MKKNEITGALRSSCVAMLVALTTSMPILGWAQSAPTAGRSTTEKTKDETIVLSPFVVTSDGNNGYAATSTLAGTRLNTKLRDLGAAITVVTPEFMKDTGVTSIEELLT